MWFEWDEEKNRGNFKKHGLWFEEAQTIWTDCYSQEFFDKNSSDYEERFLKIGCSTKGKVLLVVFCELGSGETIRLISARKATKKEERVYEKGI